MSRRANAAVGLYAAGEAHMLIGSTAAWAKDGTIRGAVSTHGRNGTAFDAGYGANTGRRPLANRIGDTYPFLAIDAGGLTNWGAATCVARVGDGVTYLQGTWGAKTGTVFLIGDSMGALGAMNYAKANPTKVAAIVLTRPCLNLNDMVVNNRGGFAAEINTTYGGTYSESTQGPTYNPCNYGASITCPVAIWYASDDTTVPPAQHVTPFLALCSTATATSVGALGHTEAMVAAVPLDDVMSFLAAHA